MIDRRQFIELTLAGGGAVFMSALAGARGARAAGEPEPYFVQLSDTHWGYAGPANPDAANTLRKAVAAVNALPHRPEFVVFTGDLTHTTDEPVERRRRMREFREIVAGLQVKDVRFLPGEHDASLDRGAAYVESFGPTHYAFDHRGIHFVVLDNVSDPGAKVGEEQIAWLRADLAALDRAVPVVTFTHRPLFDLAPKWDWATRDGKDVVDVLLTRPHVTVFYGHIHQVHAFRTGHIAHHAARSLIFPLPAPGSQEKRAPLPWDPASPDHGLGIRSVAVAMPSGDCMLAELPPTKA
jgi:Calcineurin-like phosphoesterase